MLTRSRTLDILRVIAVLLVLGRHMEHCPREVNVFLYYLTGYWRRGGWVGVDLFFVLSGFLVAGLLFQEHQRHGSLAVWRFLVRRGWKIYPSFYALIGVTALAHFITRGTVALPAFAREIFFLQNYGPGVWNHTWSLAVEEHFYLLLPLLLVLLLRRRAANPADPFAWLPALFLLVATLCLALRVTVALHAPFDPRTHHFPTHLRIDSLLFGVVLAYFHHYRPDWFPLRRTRERGLLLAVGLLAFLPPFLFPAESTPWLSSIGLTLLYLGGGAILWALRGWEPRPTRPVRALAFLGSRSYSIYLWHMPVAIWGIALARRLLPTWNWYLYFLVYFLGSFLLGLLMAHLLELPLLRLRDRISPLRG